MKLHQVIKHLIAIWLFCAATNNYAAIDLAKTYELADKNDPQWSAVKHAYQAQKEGYNQTRSQLLPSLSLGAEVAQKNTETDGGSEDDYQQQVYSASVSQPLFQLESWYNVKKAKATDKQADIEFEAALQSFLIRILDTYLNVLRAKETLAFTKAEESAIARQKDQTEQRFQVGLIAKTDVHEAQAAYDIAVVQRIIAERDLSLTLRSLETLTGTVIQEVQYLAEDFPISLPQPNDIEAWVNLSLENNKSLLAAKFNENAAQYEYDAKKALHYPTLDLVGSYQKLSSDATSVIGGIESETPDTETTTIALQLNVPLYTGGLVSSSRRQAKSLLYKAQDDTRFTEKDLLKNVSNLVRVVQTRVAEVNAQRLSIRSAESALEATKAGYEAGTRTIVDVLDAQRLLYQAKRNYADARFNYILDSLRLKELSGILSPKDIASINEWLRI
ncbi:MAG: TolC family outer membrane protein [Pseudomonadales bacterium]|nr:TolC family outer membrane protein [Pseudomonadales bacterium]